MLKLYVHHGSFLPLTDGIMDFETTYYTGSHATTSLAQAGLYGTQVLTTPRTQLGKFLQESLVPERRGSLHLVSPFVLSLPPTTTLSLRKTVEHGVSIFVKKGRPREDILSTICLPWQGNRIAVVNGFQADGADRLGAVLLYVIRHSLAL